MGQIHEDEVACWNVEEAVDINVCKINLKNEV
jgi:hypothetical protein